MSIKIAPSILTADFSNLGALINKLESGGADDIHLDIMDGKFVPNLTFGPLIAASLREVTSFPLDVHLMVEAPERYFSAFAKAGVKSLTIHSETCQHLYRSVQLIKEMGLKAGVALNPATPLSVLEYIIQDLDLVLIMTVNPGWGISEDEYWQEYEWYNAYQIIVMDKVYKDVISEAENKSKLPIIGIGDNNSEVMKKQELQKSYWVQYTMKLKKTGRR